MTMNPILDEIRAAREKLLADAGGDLDRLVAGIRERQSRSGHRVVSGPVGDSHRTKDCTGAADSTAANSKPSPAAR